MHISKKICFFLLCIFSINSLGFTEENILTPFHENISLAKIKGKDIKEFDVFGLPSSVKERKKLPVEERNRIIENYIFDKLLQTEGNIPSVTNSEEYRKIYDNLISKNAVEYLRDYIVNEQFITQKMIDDHYMNNKAKFSDKSAVKDRELIIADLKKEKGKEIQKFINNYLDNLKTANKVKYNNDLFKSVSLIKAKDIDEFSESVKKLGLNNELVSYENQKVYLSQLYNQIKKLKQYHISNLSDIDVLKSMVDGSILNSILILKAKKEKMFEKDAVKNKTLDQIKYFVSQKYKEIITGDEKFIPTKDEMIDYYIAHKEDDELKSKRKMWVFEIFKEYNNNDEKEDNDKIKVAIELENIKQKIQNGESFEKYAKFYPRPHTKDGELGFIFETDHAMIGKTAAKMNSGEISELIIQEKAISVIKVTKIQEPMLYKFDYVEEIIKRRLIDIKKDKFLKDYKKELFEKYKVELLMDNSEEKK